MDLDHVFGIIFIRDSAIRIHQNARKYLDKPIIFRESTRNNVENSWKSKGVLPYKSWLLFRVYMEDEILPSDVGDYYHKPRHKDPVIKQPGFQWKVC